MQRSIYSLKWAWGIYKRFANQYPRATEIVCDLCGINAKTPVFALANNEPFWSGFRDCVKFIDEKMNGYAKFPKYYTNVELNASRIHQYLTKSPVFALDKAEIETRIKKFPFLGGMGDKVSENSLELF